MSPISYHHVRREDGQESLSVFLPGDLLPVVVTSDHPHFQLIQDIIRDPLNESLDIADEIRELADLSIAVAQRFEKLSERVSVASGRVYFDGDEVDGSITRLIVRGLEEGVGDWLPYVSFLENIATNPNDHSREQLFDWLNARDFTITTDGAFIGYKGVTKDKDDNLVSVHSGPAIVDGEATTGQVPNAVGSTVEMPRSQVTHNPAEACSSGLHIGTYSYAQSWARGAMLRVKVYPRDVVSVPTDAGGEKVRVCRYTVDDVIDAPETATVFESTVSGGSDIHDDIDAEYGQSYGGYDTTNGSAY